MDNWSLCIVHRVTLLLSAYPCCLLPWTPSSTCCYFPNPAACPLSPSAASVFSFHPLHGNLVRDKNADNIDIYDVSLYTSPSPAPVANGLIPAPKAIKRKLNVSKPSPPIKRITNGQKAGQTRKSIDPSSSASSSSSDSGSEADAGNTSESSNASGRSSASKVKTKRPRLAPKRPSVVQAASQKPASRKVSTTQLHPARAHVIKRMTEVMQAFFGDSLEIDKVGMYASELEQGLWEDRKELVNGKEAPGAKYK